MSSTRSSRSKKAEASPQVKVAYKETNGTDDDTEQEEIEIKSEDSNDEESSASDKPKRRGDPTFNRAAFSMPEDVKKLMERVLCCSCGKQLNPMNPGAVRRHPWLKVVTCKKCYKFLRSGPFTRDDDGIDEQCRWCGDGGRLYGCDYCHNCFCRSCIKRNMGRSEAAMMESEEDSKWHCYICKPKKIKKLVEDCAKIKNYIEAQDKKDREKEERAKQREKEKNEKLKDKGKKKEKDKKEENEKKEANDKNDDKDKKEEKGTPKRAFPAPRDKSLLAEKLTTEKKATDTTKSAMSVSQSAPDLIVVNDSPGKPLHHRAVHYRPDIKTGVQHVQRLTNNVTAVTVGPKNDKPVVNIIPKSLPRQPFGQKPLLMGMLTTGGTRSPTPSNPYNLDRNIVKKMPPLNDIKALKNNIFPYNVENVAEKMSTMTQSLSLSLNSIKTDLAIAKLSQANMFQVKQMGAAQMRNGLEFFFNQLRELLHVQFVANLPQVNAADRSQGDTTPLTTSSLTSTPKSKQEPLVNSVSGKLNESAIPIEIDESSPVKHVEKMETDDDVVVMSDNESNDVVVVTDNDTKETKVLHINEDKVTKEELVNGDAEKSEDSVLLEENQENETVDEITINDDDDDDDDDGGGSSKSDKKRENTSRSKKANKKDENLKNDVKETCDKAKESKETPEIKSADKDKETDDSESIEGRESPRDSDGGDINDINEKESEQKGSKNKVDDSENTAAELELLKEMADELNEQEEKSKEPRRSSRTKKPEMSETKDESDNESPVRRKSSRQRQKPEGDSKEKIDDKQEKCSSEKRRKSASDSKKSGKVREDSEVDEDKEKSSKKENKRAAEKEKKSPKKSGDGSKIDYDVNSDDEVSEKDKKCSSEKRRKSASDSKKSGKVREDSEVDEDKEKSSKKENKRAAEKEKKSPKKSGDGSKIDYDVNSDDEVSEKDNKPKVSKSRSNKINEGSDDEIEEVVDKNSKKGDNKTSKKQTKSSDRNKVVSDSDTELEITGKKKKKLEDEKKKGSAKPIKIEENEVDVLDEDPTDESDTTESSDESVEEFGKRKKKRKAASKEEETPKRQTRQSEKKTEDSDSDSEFDPELEKEIKNLSKDTRLTRKKAKETQESKKGKSKKEIQKEKEKEKEEKKGKKKAIVEDSDLSSGIEEVSEAEDNDSEDDTDNLSASQLKKLKQAGKVALEEESGEDRPDDFSDSTDDPEVSFPKLGSAKKGKKHDIEELSDDSDFMTPKKKKKRVRDKLLDANISDSESDTGKKGKKGKGKKGAKKRKKEDTDEFSELSDEAENRKTGPKGKKRRRIKKIASSEEDEKEPGADDKVGSDDDDGQGGFLKRKHIRRVIGSKKLTDETKAAQRAEEERRKRIENRQKEYNTYVEVEGGESGEEEELAEGTEREMTTPVKEADDTIAKILGSPRKIPVTTKCVLEMDKEKKKPLIEVDRTLIRKLKPHQVEAVRFMYNCCVESMSRLKKEEGSGCIVAHCMGLGKTLSVISFVHTMLANVKLTKMTKCLVVCPLNTCLNWVNEFEIWLDDVDFEIEVYEMSKVKQNFERAQMLKEWHEGGAAVLIMGYDMYRNLVMGSHCKNKKQKKIFYETLADPGPDLVVCDEGHILKNDATSLSKSMSKIVSRRRIVLTGTPLQNNLGEYHCMVSFVKPSLLGTRKEFNNRFCNPIINGQCSDSTGFDVKLMKRRAHILHELLNGCVQRKDYSALTKYLPPKFEYVISVRLAPVQMTLYEKYLEMNVGGADVRSKGARLFTDYHALMRIWTHPWVMKLDEIRQENKRMLDDDEDSFVEDSDSYDDSFVDDSSTSSSNSSSDDVGDSSSSDKKKKKKKRKTRGNKGSSSSDDESKKENGDEVVKKWTSKRRGNEEGAGSSWMEDMGYSAEPKGVTTQWWNEYVKEEDKYKIELSGKLLLMFEILKMCEDIGDKVLIFSQSLLSLDIIEDFLAKVDEVNNPSYDSTSDDKPSTSETPGTSTSGASASGASASGASASGKTGEENGEEKEKTQEEKNKERLSQYGKSWSKGLDYFRMDGSTNSQNRKSSQDQFNDPENYRARLFLISTKAGSLGINLVSANRVIIFDASWNPSHDIQSIFRVYRFGQVKPVYVYRFLAQGTMEEKIYERQVTKQSLSQRVVDEHQIERHFTSSDLQELYNFTPDRLDDDKNKDKPLPILPKDHMLAELMTNNKDWIVKYHEHDSLLENVIEQELSEEEKKAAWEDFENEKKGINSAMGGMQMNPAFMATQQMNMQNLLMQGQANLGQAAVLQIVQDLKTRFPNLPPEVFQQRVQAVLKQVLTQQIMQQSEMQRRQIEHQRMNELNRLNQIKQEIQRQQAMINNQQRGYPGMQQSMSTSALQALVPQGLRPQTLSQLPMRTNLNFNTQPKK